MRGPGDCLFAGFRQHPLADLIDQAGIFRNRDKFCRRDHASFRVVPTQQRLEAGYAVIVEPDAGLKVDFELLVVDGLVKIHLELAPNLSPRVHVLVVKAKGLSSLRFDPIERQISLVD